MKTTRSTVIIDGKEYILIPIECNKILHGVAKSYLDYGQEVGTVTANQIMVIGDIRYDVSIACPLLKIIVNATKEKESKKE